MWFCSTSGGLWLLALPQKLQQLSFIFLFWLLLNLVSIRHIIGEGNGREMNVRASRELKATLKFSGTAKWTDVACFNHHASSYNTVIFSRWFFYSTNGFSWNVRDSLRTALSWSWRSLPLLENHWWENTRYAAVFGAIWALHRRQNESRTSVNLWYKLMQRVTGSNLECISERKFSCKTKLEPNCNIGLAFQQLRIKPVTLGCRVI